MSARPGGFVVLVVGSAGSGKSTVARRIAARHRAALLDKDELSGEFVALALSLGGRRPDDRESDDFYRQSVMPLEYSALFRVCGSNLTNGLPVVIDAPFAAYLTDPEFIQRAKTEHAWPETPVIVAHVRVDPRIIRERLTLRGNPRDEWKLSHWDEFWARYGSLEPAWRGVQRAEVPNHVKPDLSRLDALLA